jgi:hypothetical protein
MSDENNAVYQGWDGGYVVEWNRQFAWNGGKPMTPSMSYHRSNYRGTAKTMAQAVKMVQDELNSEP